MRPREPRPRVDLIRLDEAAAPPPSGHRREGRGDASPTQHLDGLTAPHLHLATLPEIGEAFGEEYQAFSRQSEPSEQRLVKDEYGRYLWMGSE